MSWAANAKSLMTMPVLVEQTEHTMVFGARHASHANGCPGWCSFCEIQTKMDAGLPPPCELCALRHPRGFPGGDWELCLEYAISRWDDQQEAEANPPRPIRPNPVESVIR